MFDIKKILSRSWHVLWNYRVLWVFGFLIALTAFGGNSGNQTRWTVNNNQERTVYRMPDDWEGLQGDTFAEVYEDGMRQMRAGLETLQQKHPVEFQLGIAAAVTAFVVILVISVITAVLRYVSEAAAIRMVDEYEETGVKVGFRQGWRYGWNRSAWRLFGVNFVVHLPVLGLFILLGLVTWRIFSALMSGVESTIISNVIAGSGLAFLGIFVVIIVMVVLYVMRDLAWRIIVLEDSPAMAALGQGWALLKAQLKNVSMMWLVMVGLKIAWGIVLLVLVIPLLIVSLITAIGGLATALIPSLLTAGITSLFAMPEYWPWIFAGIIGLPFFLVVTFSPMILVTGWGMIFESSVWTLTYRELKAIETVESAAPVQVIETENESQNAEQA